MATMLKGIVDEVVYRNEESGYCVVELDTGKELVTVVGELAGICEGVQMTVYGEFETHRTYGPQFRAQLAQQVLPKSAAAILKYLSGGVLPGVGPAIAERLVQAFGNDTLRVIAKQPEQLAQIKGISAKKAQLLSEKLSGIMGMRETLDDLAAMEIDLSDSLQLYRCYGNASAEIIADNPYLLCGFPLYKPFEQTDAYARARGVEPEADNRLRAGFVYVLRHNAFANGHTCLPDEKLVDAVYRFLDIDRDLAEIKLYEYIDAGDLSGAHIGRGYYVFLNDLYKCEKYISERIRLLGELSFRDADDAAGRIAEFEKSSGITYAAAQREAISAALSQGVTVITGGPGTGKTTAVNAIIALCEQQDDKVVLAAPTGRAAKRMSELCGREAKTIHRLLEVDYTESDRIKFVHDENDPIDCDVCVVDEMSMVDVELFRSLLAGLHHQCRLVLVGDCDQLPAVGAGSILRDLIKSEVCRTVELEKIFRQAAKSLIVTNAHRIVEGYMPEPGAREDDFFFLERERNAAPELIGQLVARRLPKSYNFDPMNDIQVLTPTRRGEMGTTMLNDRLRELLNPRARTKAEISVFGSTLREGDKVMQVKNNYDLKYERAGGESGAGVFNGDIGCIEKIDYAAQTLNVRFEDRLATYTFEQAKQLESAYAVTVHKSQGSEFEAVVLALGAVPQKLCYRNLLYTAVTRAKKLLVIVGERAALEQMVENTRKQNRCTGLAKFLQQSDKYETL